MSDFELREGSGFIFENTTKDGSPLPENAPKYKGKCLINGKEQEIALWLSEEGKKHKLTFKINDPWKPEPQAEKVADSDLPF